jgi:HEAT repeat protein
LNDRAAIYGGMHDEADDAVAQDIAQMFALLLKGLKNIGIYRHAENRYAEFLAPAHQMMSSFLEREMILPLKKRVIYEDQNKENLTYKFYRDGMRFLIFRQGVPVEELLRFLLLILDSHADASYAHEDTITRLWKEDFRFIEYIVVEGFEFGDMTPEQVEIEVDRIVSYLRKQLEANSADVTRFARLDVEDLKLELSDVDQVRGGIISGRPARSEDKQWVQDELYLEEKKRLFAKMVLILFQLLERDCRESDLAAMTESFVQVLDSLLVSEDVRGAVAVLHRFDKIGTKNTLGEEQRGLVRRIRDTFARRMAEPERLQTVTQYMALSKSLDELAVRSYLSVLSADQVPLLLDMLEGMERAEARRILVEVCAELGKNDVDQFALRLSHRSSNVVKDMLAIIDRIDPPNKLDLYAKCLDHPNIVVRLDVLKTIGRASGERALKYLEKAARDPEIQLRMQAYRMLAVRSSDRAVPLLGEVFAAPDFLDRDKREQAAIVLGLGDARTPEALQMLTAPLLVKTTLFNRAKTTDMKLLAIRGLAAARTVEAFNLLAREVQNRNHPKEVLEAAHKAALRLRAELTGEAVEEESVDG